MSGGGGGAGGGEGEDPDDRKGKSGVVTELHSRLCSLEEREGRKRLRQCTGEATNHEPPHCTRGREQRDRLRLQWP
jgi:hypothetical protein